MFRHLKVAFALLSLVLISNVSASAQETPPPAPTGEYMTTISLQELPTDMPEGMRKALAGKWEFAFGTENRFEIALNNKPVVGGHFTHAKDSITLTDEKGVISCAIAKGEETGKYSMTMDGTKLTFKAVDDRCEGRKLILTMHPWTRVEVAPVPTPSPKKPS